MKQKSTDWKQALEAWFGPFLEAFGHKKRRHWAPVYLQGLLMPGDRKSIQPMAERVAPGDMAQLHNFIAASKWPTEPIEEVLFDKVDQLVGGDDAHLIIDDTALPKKGDLSVGVSHQYCGQLGKQSNCQSLVSLTLARHDLPVPVALKLFLPKSWTDDLKRRRSVGIPDEVFYQPKWKIALREIARVREHGVRFGDVLADAGYGACAAFRHGLSEMGLTWAVGINSTQHVYPRSVRTSMKVSLGRPFIHPTPTMSRRSVTRAIDALGPSAFQPISWRSGTKGPLTADFAAVRIRVADGPKASQGIHLPGEEAWLVCERRRGGETKYYLTNHSAKTPLETIAAALKARWSCEQAHQQLKEELGLDHFEGRSWLGLHHHALMTLIAFAFLQHLRIRENKS